MTGTAEGANFMGGRYVKFIAIKILLVFKNMGQNTNSTLFLLWISLPGITMMMRSKFSPLTYSKPYAVLLFFGGAHSWATTFPCVAPAGPGRLHCLPLPLQQSGELARAVGRGGSRRGRPWGARRGGGAALLQQVPQSLGSLRQEL